MTINEKYRVWITDILARSGRKWKKIPQATRRRRERKRHIALVNRALEIHRRVGIHAQRYALRD